MQQLNGKFLLYFLFLSNFIPSETTLFRAKAKFCIVICEIIEITSSTTCQEPAINLFLKEPGLE
jgi:hypothetical protein